MAVQWTPNQVLDLAPDDASRSNARSLASSAGKWRLLQGTEQVIWGECQGSGSDPYRCQVDLEGPGFKCSCPSRKVPCKHALALFFLYASQPRKFETGQPPEWVTTWLAKRAEQNDKRAAKNEGKPATAPDSAAQAKRAAGREKKIRAGIDELDTWLRDLLHQGLADAQSQPHSFWENAAGRLVDAQASGLARLVREMAGICASGDGWQSRLLDQMARLYLAMEGFRRIDQFSEETQADLRSLMGINQKQEEILAIGSAVSDTWLVLGREVEAETSLVAQRVWLWGLESQRPAMILTFAQPGAALDLSLAPGMAVPAELVFYPGAFPLRAIIRMRQAAQALPAALPGSTSLIEATAGYATALARYPWLERYPLALNQVIPCQDGERWLLVDQEQRSIPLARNFLNGWTMLAFSGGAPIGVFGEWNGERLLPLSLWAPGRFYPFKPRME